MTKKILIFNYIVSFFICSIVIIHFSGNSANIYFNDLESFLKGKVSVSSLARECKSQWRVQGCSEYDKQILIKYIMYFCGEMPKNTHSINRQRFEQYITSPMLNIAFLSSWSWLNNNMEWPICTVCLLDYPLHPYWEMNFSFCDQ